MNCLARDAEEGKKKKKKILEEIYKDVYSIKETINEEFDHSR